MIFSRKLVQSLMKGNRLSNAIKRHHHLREKVESQSVRGLKSSLAETSCQLDPICNTERVARPLYRRVRPERRVSTLGPPRPTQTYFGLTQAQNHDTGNTMKKSSKAHSIEKRMFVFAIFALFVRYL